MKRRRNARLLTRNALVGLKMAHETADVLTPESRRAVVATLIRRPRQPVIRADFSRVVPRLAARMGTSQSTITRLESGQPLPGTKTFLRYAEATGSRFQVRPSAARGVTHAGLGYDIVQNRTVELLIP